MSTPNAAGTRHLAGTVTKAGLSGQGSILGPREIAVIASTGAVDLQNDEVVPGGMTPSRCDVPVFLNHQSDGNNLPIGRAYLRVSGNAVVGTIIFAPEGDSEVADSVCRAYKNGTMDAVSVGFTPIKSSRRAGGRGTKYETWICHELSCCGVGANSEARVVQRQLDAAQAERATRMAHAAEVLAKSDRRLRAMELARIGREQEARHKAAEPRPLTRDERIAKARATARAGMTEQERRVADLPPGRERYEAELALHASKALSSVAARDWDTNATADVRKAKEADVARRSRKAGW